MLFEDSIKYIQSGTQENIILFGAGRYANLVYVYLKREGLEKRIRYVVVTSMENNPNSFYGIAVKTLEEVSLDIVGNHLIIAMSKNSAKSVVEACASCEAKTISIIGDNTIDFLKNEIYKSFSQITIQSNKIMFYCYSGMGYRCNCKYIAEKLRSSALYSLIIWVTNGGIFSDIPEGITQVVLGTEEYYREAYSSKIIITNVNRDPFVEKREGQYYINTWHGYGPFKKVGISAINNRSEWEKMERNMEYFDLFISGSVFYSQVYRESFLYKGSIMECGAPRNDILFESGSTKEKVFNFYGIPHSKKIVLYAPTFRENMQQSFFFFNLNMDSVLEELNEKFSGEYVLVYRFHHNLYKYMGCNPYKEIGYNATFYDDTQELLVAADVVITDYSSLMWDFSLQRKPVFLYQNDASEYEDERGFYAPVEEWPYPVAHTQQELLSVIKEFDNEAYVKELNAFLEKYGSCDDGHASERVVELIREKMKE